MYIYILFIDIQIVISSSIQPPHIPRPPGHVQHHGQHEAPHCALCDGRAPWGAQQVQGAELWRSIGRSSAMGFCPGENHGKISGEYELYIYYIYDICLVSGIWTSGVFLFNVFMENDILMMLYNNGFQLRMVWNEAFICQSWTARWRMSAPGTPPIWMRNDDGKPVFIMWPAGCLRTSWKAVDWNCFPDVALRPKFQTQ